MNGKLNPADDVDGAELLAEWWWIGEEEVLGGDGDAEYERVGPYSSNEDEVGKNAFTSVVGMVGNNPATSVFPTTSQRTRIE